MQYLFAWTILGTIVLMKQTYGLTYLEGNVVFSKLVLCELPRKKSFPFRIEMYLKQL